MKIHTQNMDEYLDLVDENDHVIGREKRSIIYQNRQSNFRVINVFIINSRGELWIPRRTAIKSIFPLCLDISAAGHVESGETYEEALQRETLEELNIDLRKTPHRFLGNLTPQKDGVSSFQKAYEIKMDGVPNFNRNDFIEYFWLTPKQFFERIRNGDKAKSDLPKLVEIFYGTGLA